MMVDSWGRANAQGIATTRQHDGFDMSLKVFLPSDSGRSGSWAVASGEASPDDQEVEKARGRLQEALTDALHRDNLCVLLGAGASAAAGLPTMDKLGRNIFRKICGNERMKDTLRVVWNAIYPDKKFEGIISKNLENDRNNISLNIDLEGFLSICKNLTDIIQKRNNMRYRKVSIENIKTIAYIIEEDIVSEVTDTSVGSGKSLQHHGRFLAWLCKRSVEKERARIFTTNYDLCIEQAAVARNIVLIDGFSRSIEQQYDRDHFRLDIVRRSPDSTRITLAPNVLHLYKLHGSIDWFRDEKRRILRKPPETGKTDADPSNPARRKKKDVGRDPAPERVLIYPRSSKYQQAFEPPFLDMFAAWQDALRRENTTLIVIGYSFRDNHVSAAIKAALESNLSFRLIVVDPSLERHADQQSVPYPAHEESARKDSPVDETAQAPEARKNGAASKRDSPDRPEILDWIIGLAAEGDGRITLVSGGFKTFVQQLPEPRGRTEFEMLRELLERVNQSHVENRGDEL